MTTPPETAAPSQSGTSPSSSWKLPGASTVLTYLALASSAVYGLAFAFAFSFYVSFNVSTQEVGFTQSDVLVHFGVVSFLFTVVVGFICIFVGILLAPVMTALLWVLTLLKIRPRRPKLNAGLIRGVVVALVILLSAAVMLTFVEKGTKHAQELRGNPDLALNRPTPLGWATGVYPRWGEATWRLESQSPPVIAKTRVLYLGSTGGVTVVYDYCEKRVLRIPAGQLHVTGPDLADRESTHSMSSESLKAYCSFNKRAP